jgi:putative hydrolase of the HAD superfamily
MIKAVVFDFDGTILDTETPWYDAFRYVYNLHGAELTLETYAQCVGTSFDAFNPYTYVQQCVQKPVDEQVFKEAINLKHNALMEGADLKPGILAYLYEAKAMGLRIGLASSSDRKWVETYLRKYQIYDYFDCIRTSENVTRVKPDPELYLQTIQYFSLKASEVIAFEDSPNGARAAKRAGLNCIIIPNSITKQLTFDEYDKELSSLSDMSLADLLRQMVR